MGFGSTPVSTTSLSQSQIPANAVAVPNHAGGNFTALRGANPSTDSNGNELADASVAIPDGANVTQGITTDAAVTGDTAGTVSAKLRGMNKILNDIWDSVNHLFHFNLKQVGGNAVVTGGANGLLAVGGPVASGSTNADNPVKTGGVFNTTQPTVTNGQVVDGQMTARGARIVATGVDTFTVVAQAVAGTALAADQANSELRVSNYVKTTTAGDTALTLGQATMANSLPVTMASNQGAIGSVTANAGTNLNTSALALESGGNLATLATNLPAKGAAATSASTPVNIASDQVVPVKRSTVAVYTLASTTTSGTTQNSGDLTVGPYTEAAIDITTTAQAGTSPTIQYFYERKGADGLYYVLWQSNVLTAAANTVSTSVGAGMAYAQSLGTTGRLRWVVGGSATPTFTHSLNLYMK